MKLVGSESGIESISRISNTGFILWSASIELSQRTLTVRMFKLAFLRFHYSDSTMTTLSTAIL